MCKQDVVAAARDGRGARRHTQTRQRMTGTQQRPAASNKPTPSHFRFCFCCSALGPYCCCLPPKIPVLGPTHPRCLLPLFLIPHSWKPTLRPESIWHLLLLPHELNIVQERESTQSYCGGSTRGRFKGRKGRLKPMSLPPPPFPRSRQSTRPSTTTHTDPFSLPQPYPSKPAVHACCDSCVLIMGVVKRLEEEVVDVREREAVDLELGQPCL